MGNVDNQIRKLNQRISRLAKFAGREEPYLNKITNQIESILDRQNIYNYYKDKYKREHPPKTPKDVQTLNKRADQYAAEKANVSAYQLYGYSTGKQINITRTAKLSDFFESRINALLAVVPTTGDVKKELVEIGQEPTGQNLNDYITLLTDFDEVMKYYYDIPNRTMYRNIKEMRQISKKERRPSYAEMAQMTEWYIIGQTPEE